MSFARACEEEDRAWDMAEALWVRIGSHPAHSGCTRRGDDFFGAIGQRCAAQTHPLAWGRTRVSDLLVTLGLCNHVRMAVDVVMNRTHPLFTGQQVHRVVPSPEMRQVVGPSAPGLRALALDCLRRAGEPLDEWHQACALAHLLAPELALGAVSFPFWHPPPPAGQGDRERQVATAVGSVDRTEKAAVVAKRDFQRRAGVVTVGKKRGPKPGSSPRKSDARRRFERYVVSRSVAGVSPSFIASDARAAGLYQASRPNGHVELTVGIVRSILRRRLFVKN